MDAWTSFLFLFQLNFLSSTFFCMIRLPTFDKVSHGIDYSKYAYHVAFLRQFYTLVQGDKNDDGKYKQDMETSTSRKWNSVVAKRGINKIKEEKAKPRSIHNGNAWETISKQYMNKAPRRLSN